MPLGSNIRIPARYREAVILSCIWTLKWHPESVPFCCEFCLSTNLRSLLMCDLATTGGGKALFLEKPFLDVCSSELPLLCPGKTGNKKNYTTTKCFSWLYRVFLLIFLSPPSRPRSWTCDIFQWSLTQETKHCKLVIDCPHWPSCKFTAFGSCVDIEKGFTEHFWEGCGSNRADESEQLQWMVGTGLWIWWRLVRAAVV